MPSSLGREKQVSNFSSNHVHFLYYRNCLRQSSSTDLTRLACVVRQRVLVHSPQWFPCCRVNKRHKFRGIRNLTTWQMKIYPSLVSIAKKKKKILELARLSAVCSVACLAAWHKTLQKRKAGTLLLGCFRIFPLYALGDRINT